MRTTKHEAYKTALIALITALTMAAASGTFAIAATTGNERIAAHMDPPHVVGWNWSPDLEVSVQVTGPDFDETQVGNTGDGFFSFEFSAMEPGFVVTATSDGHTETHVVANLVNVVADEVTDTVSGNADLGLQLTAFVDADSPTDRIFTVTSDPFTSPSFLDPPGAGEGEGTFDLVPGTQGGIFWRAADGNYTVNRWRVPNPTVRANWVEDYVTSNPDWPVGASVTVTVEDSGGALKCTDTLTVHEWLHEEGGESGFEWSASCDIVPGDVVTATTGDGPDDITMSVEVTPLQIMGFDEVSDLVIGVATLGSEVHVNGGNDESWGWRNVVADGETPPDGFDPVDASLGWWVADFTEAALSGGAEGDGWVDIRSGTGGEAVQSDAEGDETFEWWGLEDPWIAVHRLESRVGGGSFEPGTVPLTVDDPATTGVGFEPDFETSVDVDESGYFDAEVGEFITIEPDFVVTVGSKSLVVSSIAVTSVNEVPGVVAGTAEADVRVEVWIHEEGGEWHQTTSDGAGNWSVTFSSLWPGVAGGALVADDDGDSTQVDWGIPNPSVRANWADDYVQSNEDWPFGAFVTVTVENDLGAVKCVTDPPVEVVDWDGWTGFDWPASCDIVPGDVVTATTGDGPDDLTTSVVVTPLQILGVDEEFDLVFGVATLDSEVHVNGGNDESWGWRNAVADGDIPEELWPEFDPGFFGWWLADFTEERFTVPGQEGDGWIDIGPGTGGEASQSDAEGDDTFEWWGVGEPASPQFTVQRDWSQAWGWNFEPGLVPLTVDDPATTGDGFEPDFETIVEVDDDGGFWIGISESFTIEPGHVVTAGDKSLVVMDLTADVDPATNRVFGTADAEVAVQVWIHDELGEYHEITADGSGAWSVTFTELLPGTQGAAAVPDEDGDFTQVDWSIPNPSVRVNWFEDYVTSNPDWPLGALVTVTVEDSAGAVKCVTDPPVEVVDFDGWTGFDWPASCDIVPGDVVTATTGDGPDDLTTSVVVTPLQILGVDEEFDLVFGVATLDSEVHVNGGNDESWGWRNAVADGDIPEELWPEFDPGFFGWWLADFTEERFTVPGQEGDGWIDIRPGAGGEASQSDAEGDQTFEWWNVDEAQLPTFTVHRQHDWVWGDPAWVGPVTISVDGLEWTVPVDEHGFFLDLWDVLDIVEGLEFTVTGDDGFAKTHAVTGIEPNEPDPAADTVEGASYPGSQIVVWIHETEVYRFVTAGPEWPNWHVDFSTLGSADDENGVFDLVPGTAGGASEFDDDGDATQVEWNVNRPPVAEDDSFGTDEDIGLAGMDVLGNDWDPDGDEIAYESHDTTGTIGEVVWDGAFFEYDPGDGFAYLGTGDLATDTWTYVITDGRGGTDQATVTVYLTGINDAPEMSHQPGQEVQYSDGLVLIVFTATDVDTDLLSMSASGLPDGLSAVSVCAPGAVSGVECTLTITGTVVAPAGHYDVEVTAGDGEFETTAGTTITVLHEDADVSLHGGNDTAIPVAQHDESGPFELMFKVRHADPDVGFAPTAGDLALAGTALTLDPVGPGGPIEGACDSVTETGSGYDTMLTVVCTFDDVPINTYLVIASADSEYFGGHANGVLTVYDPHAGEVSGGGTFNWDGDPTEFGFTMEYNKKGNNLQGAFLLIRHVGDDVYIVKSNSLYGMAIGDEWATFSGKATLTYPSGDSYGNQEFIVMVTDDPDTFWIEVRDKDRNPIPAMSMPRDGEGEPIAPVPLASGEVVVPNGNGNGNGGGRGNH